MASGYSDLNSDKDTMSEMKCNFEEKPITTLGNVVSTDVSLISETSSSCSVKTVENTDSTYNLGFKYGLVQTSSTEKPPFAFENPIASNTKQLENPSSVSVKKSSYSDVNQGTIYAGLNSESVQNLSGIKSVPIFEDSLDKNAAKSAGFKFVASDVDSTICKNVTSKTGDFKFTVNDAESPILIGSTSKTEGLKFPVNNTDSVSSEDVTSKIESFKVEGLKFTATNIDSITPKYVTDEMEGSKFAISHIDSLTCKDATSKSEGIKFADYDSHSTTSKYVASKTECFKFEVNDTDLTTSKGVTSKTEGFKLGFEVNDINATTIKDDAAKTEGFKFSVNDTNSTTAKYVVSKTEGLDIEGFKFANNDTNSTFSKDITSKTEGFKFVGSDTDSTTFKDVTSKSEGFKFAGSNIDSTISKDVASKIEDFKFDVNVTDSITSSQDITSKTTFMPIIPPKENPVITLNDLPSAGSSKLDKTSSNSNAHKNEIITSNSEFKSELKSSLASIEKKFGSSSIQTITECSKFDINRSTTSYEDLKLEPTSSASREQHNISFGNLFTTSTAKIENFTSGIAINDIKPTFSKDGLLNKKASFSSNVDLSKAKETATLGNSSISSSERLGNYSFGTSLNETKSAADAKLNTATVFSFHSPSSSSKYESRPYLKKPPRYRTSPGSTFGAPNTSKIFEGFTFGNSTGFSFGSVKNDSGSGFTFGNRNTFSFGSDKSNTVSGFTFGNQNNFSFGSDKSNTVSGSTFGNQNNFSFGSDKSNIVSGFTFGNPDEKPKGTQGVKYHPLTDTDTLINYGYNETVQTKHQCITVMPEYLNKSLEELRYEDYKLMGRGPYFFLDVTKTNGVDELLKGLEELLSSRKLSDVTLNVQDKEFNVHKAILAIRSPVFSAMMEHETKEKDTGVVNIPDCEPGPFFDFLHFLYTGSTEKLTKENVLDLYVIADKYQVPQLCRICVNYMKNNISVQNFCDTLSLALRHHEKELIDVCTQFFVEYSTEITVTVEWGLFVKTNPVAANELFIKALKTYKK